ncbi:RHS repeat-associated core domain-containing protein [Caulobacter sp. NIBR1757]|uniref:RHS repeat-associated core domain-containing protein n=1 Tax=Caulobacter sp. NIBR1757 TaxID=3016000 RepID=UPI0022EFF382|nr:RHS repeat-associated core domain-containing protein [Caulobacter sp. NIBR1757]WGM40007.1 hypothetical protein AMEJIAPC_02948 [Caulobacter sp. NIBR1757]
MTYDGVRYFAYDERRNLTLARQGALTAGNYEQDLYDALGARWYSARATTTIADTRRVELTDGLRPEVAVEEMINIPEGTTDQDAAGGRFSVMGPNPDERLIWIDATATALQVRYVHASRRGDARILSKGGAPERKYTYSAFGESTDNVTGYPWRFTGQRFNSWTGLYHFKARAYSPALGRFMQPDPIGYEDGANIYAYVQNDPINANDPTGLLTIIITGAGERSGISYHNSKDYAERLAGLKPGERIVVIDWTKTDETLAGQISANMLDSQERGEKENLNIIGFSMGGPRAMILTEMLGQSGVKVDNLTTVDPVGPATSTPFTIKPGTWTNITATGTIRTVGDFLAWLGGRTMVERGGNKPDTQINSSAPHDYLGEHMQEVGPKGKTAEEILERTME